MDWVFKKFLRKFVAQVFFPIFGFAAVVAGYITLPLGLVLHQKKVELSVVVGKTLQCLPAIQE